MKQYIKKIKDWYAKLQSGNASYEKKGLRPNSDWRIMITTTFVVLCLLAIFSFYFYTKIDNGEMFVVQKGDMGRETEINKTLLEKIVTQVRTRENIINSLKDSGAVPNDPSL